MSVGDPETFKRDAGPAFPQPIDQAADGKIVWADQYRVGGMSLRDYFAAAAISPMLVQAYGTRPDILATKAFEIADAMLEARKAK